MTELDPKSKPAAGADEAASEQEGRGWLSWAVGWVLVPATILGLIWVGGVLVGVHLHDSWLSRLVVWVVGLFG